MIFSRRSSASERPLRRAPEKVAALPSPHDRHARKNFSHDDVSRPHEQRVRGRCTSRSRSQFGESLDADSLVLRRRGAFGAPARAPAAKIFSRRRSAHALCRHSRADACACAFGLAKSSCDVIWYWRRNAHSIGIFANAPIFVPKNARVKVFCCRGAAAIAMNAPPPAATALLHTKLSRNPVIFFPLV